MTDDELIERHPPVAPGCSLIWTAVVDVADKIDLGATPNGARYMVPITGGRFYAGPGRGGLSGRVLAGGADRQLVRPDGVKELDALYEMQAEDGTIITVHNRVVIDEAAPGGVYAMSVISAKVAAGPHDWLNRRLILGTLQTARPDRQAVIIRAWEAALPRG